MKLFALVFIVVCLSYLEKTDACIHPDLRTWLLHHVNHISYNDVETTTNSSVTIGGFSLPSGYNARKVKEIIQLMSGASFQDKFDNFLNQQGCPQ